MVLKAWISVELNAPISAVVRLLIWVEVSEPARKIGIEPGMTGLDALAKLLTAH